MKTKTFLFIYINICILALTLGCKEKDTSINEVTAEATIKNTPVEDNCGAYMVVIGNTDGVNAIWYKPENLSEEFKVDDLKVKITYTLTDKTHNCGFGGYKPIIIIHKIERR